MKKLVAAAIVLLLLAGLAVVTYRMGLLARVVPGPVPGGVSPGTGAPAQPATAGPGETAPEAVRPAEAASAPGDGASAFDGNIASYEWGGRMDSATGLPSDDEMSMSRPLRGKETTPGGKEANEFVISFWGREPALVDRVEIVATEEASPRDRVEVSTSASAASSGFSRVYAETLSTAKINTLRFQPIEARFVKVRLEGEPFNINWIKVFEAQRSGYVPLLSRRRDVLGPLAERGPAPASAGVVRPCDPEPALTAPGKGQSRKVLVLSDLWTGPESKGGIPWLRLKAEPLQSRLERSADLAVFDGVQVDVVVTLMAQAYHLSDAYGYDTVVLEQVSAMDNIPLSLAFTKALGPWVAAGHKLIIQDSDKVAPPPYDWLPYHFKANSPGAAGAPGEYLRILENNAMVHNRRGLPGFLDTAAWEAGDFALKYRNELGDTNTVVEWDPRWCGHIAVRNVNNVFGFGLAYAHYGRGLIIYNGFDIDMNGSSGYDILIARALAQGFDPDNLPCSAKMGEFVVTTESRLLYRPFSPGKSVEYPLTLLSNQGLKSDVTLSATASPPVPGMQARFEPAKVAVSDLHNVAFTLTIPPGAPKSMAVEVKGTAANGKANSLCLQLGPPRGGELQVVSALRPPTRTGRNLEIILDASGSMKMPLAGKRTRWDVALDTLQTVLEKLPDHFNVGLRIYGHREGSRSPKTCTDSELLVPIAPLDRQALLARVKEFKPKGETPLVYSALQAPDDLKAVGGGTVVLITDGEESCKGDTARAAADMKAAGLDIRLNIVGFALKNPKTQKELGGFAQATGGRFYAADDGAALADALLIAAIEKFPFTVYDAAGKVVVQGEAGEPPDTLPPGEYKVVVRAGGQELVAPRVKVNLGGTATITIAMKNGQLALQ